MTVSSYVYQQTAALFLAAAFLKRYPEGLLLEWGASERGFYLEGLSSIIIEDKDLTFLEETMRELYKREDPIEIKEMEPKNAGDYLSHLKQPLRAEAVRCQTSSLVKILKMGDFVDFIEEIPEKKKGVFKLNALFSKKENGFFFYRIEGFSHENKKLLKEKFEELQTKKLFDHQVLGKKLALFDPERGFLWSSRGETLWFLLEILWREWVQSQGFLIFRKEQKGNIFLQETERQAFFGIKRSLPPSKESGLLNFPLQRGDECKIYCKKEDFVSESISCLRFLEKILIMFEFEYRLVLRFKRGRESDMLFSSALKEGMFPYLCIRDAALEVPRLEVEISDIYGQYWSGPFMEFYKREGYLKISYLGSMERFIALLLERTRGSLPWNLVPEQLRILSIGLEKEKAEKYVEELNLKGLRYSLDKRELSLQEKRKEAALMCIPFIGVIGPYELAKNQITLRRWGQKEDETVDADKMTREYLEEKFENKQRNKSS